MHGKSFAGGFLAGVGFMLLIAAVFSATVLAPYISMYRENYDKIQQLYNITHDPNVENVVYSMAMLGMYASSILNSSAVSMAHLIPGFDSLRDTIQRIADAAVEWAHTFSQLQAVSERLVAVKPLAANWEAIEAALAVFGIVFLVAGTVLAKRDKPKQA